MIKTYNKEYVFDYARKHSPYHAELYKDLPEDYVWEDIPLISQDDYWGSELSHLTGPHMDGQVFKSGGTTGEPKYCYYSHDEWMTFAEGTAMRMPGGGLEHGDKVLNLFYGGGLYASFLYVYTMLYFSPKTVVQYNLGGAVEIEEMVNMIMKNNINVIMGLPSVIMKIVEYIELHEIKETPLTVIYFAGETLFPQQRAKICEKLGKTIEFRSANYASNDGGIMAYFAQDCGFNEHHAYDQLCMVEIIDEDTGEVITEMNRPGKIYITALYRTLMPMIRYPAGDLGEYTEEPKANRKFRLLGRGQEAARVGFVSISPEDIQLVVDKCGIQSDTQQMVISKADDKDLLTIYVATAQLGTTEENDGVAQKFLETLYVERALLKETEEKGVIETTKVIICGLGELEYNARTGKLKKVLDKRHG